MSFNVGPITLSVVQLFVVAIGIAAALWIFNAVWKSGSKAVWIMLALPVFIIFLIIAFFKVSELSLFPFMAKFIANNFFDTNKKFQVNHQKFSKTQILIEKSKIDQTKNNKVDAKKETDLWQEMLDRIEKWWLL